MLPFSQLISSLGSELEGSNLQSSFGLSAQEMDEDLEEGQIICGTSTAKKHGVEVRCRRGLIETIFLYGQTVQGLVPYRGALPEGLTFSAPLATVRFSLGQPSKCGPALTDPILGNFGPWDRYDFADHCLHFQYAIGGNGIAMVTLMHERPVSMS